MPPWGQTRPAPGPPLRAARIIFAPVRQVQKSPAPSVPSVRHARRALPLRPAPRAAARVPSTRCSGTNDRPESTTSLAYNARAPILMASVEGDLFRVLLYDRLMSLP